MHMILPDWSLIRRLSWCSWTLERTIFNFLSSSQSSPGWSGHVDTKYSSKSECCPAINVRPLDCEYIHSAFRLKKIIHFIIIIDSNLNLISHIDFMSGLVHLFLNIELIIFPESAKIQNRITPPSWYNCTLTFVRFGQQTAGYLLKINYLSLAPMTMPSSTRRFKHQLMTNGL